MPNAILFYRFARWLFLMNVPMIPKLIQLIIFLLYNSKLPANASIGSGSFLVCKGIGVVVIDNACIGKNCRIGIGVKIVGKSPFIEVPIIGNNVFIGPGAVIVGPVIIEDDVIIAPNSVVTKSIRKGSIIGGIPAKIIGKVADLDYNLLDIKATMKGHAEFI